MPTTNLDLVTSLNGSSIELKDIKIDFEVYYPSGCSGVIRYKCISYDSKEAVFVSQNTEWPGEFSMVFNYPDFCINDFKQLESALKIFSTLGVVEHKQVTVKDRQIVKIACQLGYAFQRSYTQAEWTEKGLSLFEA